MSDNCIFKFLSVMDLVEKWRSSTSREEMGLQFEAQYFIALRNFLNYNTRKNTDESYKPKFEQMNSNTKGYLLYNVLLYKVQKETKLINGRNEDSGSLLLWRGDGVTRNEA